MTEQHFEPYVSLVDVTADAALIAWGGFYFQLRDRASGDWLLVDDEQLHEVSRTRHETIGARSAPYGRAVVEVSDEHGVAARTETDSVNHVWVEGLAPDTTYRYRVVVDGRGWAEDDLYDWEPATEQGGGGLRRSGRRYEHRFRTHPRADDPAPLTFVAIGDFGFGVHGPDETALRQHRIAQALERAVDTRGVRLVVTTGDNVYLGSSRTPEATGREDDDWFFSYYQPYRYVINRVPVYPAVGNHDTSDTERSDDRQQLQDNFYIAQRFRPAVAQGRASLDPGLYYRLDFGRHVRLVAVDTSQASELDEKQYYDHPEHVTFLDDALAEDAPRWTVPFSHHPPYCAGPSHHNLDSLIARLRGPIRRAGVRLVLSGHEHNFQHQVVDDVHFFVSGAGGKLRSGTPQRFEEAGTRSWAAQGHFLLVELAEQARVYPVTDCDTDGVLRLITAKAPNGGAVRLPVVISAERREPDGG